MNSSAQQVDLRLPSKLHLRIVVGFVELFERYACRSVIVLGTFKVETVDLCTSLKTHHLYLTETAILHSKL